MSELRSVVEALRADVLADAPDALLQEDFAELHRVTQLLEVERLRRLAEIERRGLYQRDGYLSVTAWLKDRFRVAGGSARQAARTARSLRSMPATQRALQEGEISLSSARVLVAAREEAPDAFEAMEATLVDAARRHSPEDLQRVTAFWRERVEAERADHDPRAGRRLHASVTLGGTVRVDGDLDPEAGEALLTALGAVMDAEVRVTQDGRTPAQRRADALHEICRQWLDRTDRPSVAGERPHVTLTVDVDAMRRPSEGAAEFDHAGVVAASVARRLACDASITRVVMAGRSEPLDVGRRTPVVPPAVRRAIIARDRACRFPGCDRRQSWCDAHHVRHWADGGETAPSNLLLLCRPHHRMIHERGFGVTIQRGSPSFTRPDGTVLLEDRGPSVSSAVVGCTSVDHPKALLDAPGPNGPIERHDRP